MELKLNKDYKRVPVEDAIQPKEGLTVTYKNRHWVVTPENEILFYRGMSPQCNHNPDVVRKLAPEGCGVRYLEVVFIKIRSEDWDIRI